MRKTKIICTLGPSTDKDGVLRELVANGMNVARFNFSHGSYEEHKGRLDMLKAIRAELNKPVAALLDTKGPEIRLKEFKNGVEMLEAGQTFTLTTREVEGTKEICSITYKDLPMDVEPNGTIMLDDGLIMLHIEQVTDTDIICTVLNSGKIKTKKGVNVPGVHLSMPYMSQRDTSDILFGVEQGFDLISASFARNAQDIMDIRHILDEHNSKIRIIAKIENQEGLDNIDEIIEASYGIMVARGDLGVELPAEVIPNTQRRIVEKCICAKRPVIIATQMLYSMVKSPRPTRAEVSDVASAIYERVDAVMLSDETAMGDYPVEAVSTMSRVAREIEKDETHFTPMIDMNMVSVNHEITAQLARSAVRASTNLPIRYVVLDTATGRTGRYLVAFVGRCRFLAVCYTRHAQRILALSYGVVPILREQQSHERYQDRYHFVIDALDFIQRKHAIEPTDLLAVVGGSFDSKYGASYLEISSAERFRERDAVCDGC